MASGSIDRNAKDALSKLLQMGTVAEYQNEFEMLINRVMEISEYLLKSFYICGLKVALQIELLRARPTTLGEAFSLAHVTEACFEDEQSTTAIAKPNNLNTRVEELASRLKGCPIQILSIRFVSTGALIESPRWRASDLGFQKTNCSRGSIDRDTKDALSKLLQMGTVAEYQNEFEMLINRVTGISESLLKSFYISGLKVVLQIELLRARPTNLGEAFSLACVTRGRGSRS
ncbi:hypothetical protein Tco_0115387 [Tanacetum coccineum]